MHDEWSPIRYPGSFQKGPLFRTGDPLAAVWTHVRRIGTIDSLTRIASKRRENRAEADSVEQRELDARVVRVACLRVQQALEMRGAARGTSLLSRPILLYYAMLNMVRGLLLATRGHAGGPRHGLLYKAGADLLSCTATMTPGKGTFPEVVMFSGMKADAIEGATLSLRDLLAVLPESASDFALLARGATSIATVDVEATMDGPTRLKYRVPDASPSDFQAR